MAEVKILHWWAADNRGWKNRLPPHCDRGDMHLRIKIRERIKAGVITERAFGHQWLGRIDVSLEHEVGFRRYFQITRECPRQRDGLAAQESGEQKLVDRRWQWRTRRIYRWRIGAKRDAHWHPFTTLRHLAPVRRADFVPLPMHRQRISSRLHDAVHADVANATPGVARDDHREGDVRATIFGPTLHQW